MTAEPTSTTSSQPPPGLFILAVDDRPANLIALERVLASVPAKVIKAHNGEEALAAALHHRFALAILDVQMPGMDGYELAEIMRGDPTIASTPIIFVSAAYSDESHQFRGYTAGAVDYLVKPYIPEVLLSKVRIFLELARHRHDLEGLVAERTRALAESEQRHRTLYETMAQGVVYQGASGAIIDANPAALRILGVERSDLLGRDSGSSEWHAVDGDGFPLPGEAHPSMRALRTGLPVFDEVMGLHHPIRDQRTWLSVTAIPQRRTGAGPIDHVYTMFSDITARRVAEQQLEASERALRAVFEGTQDGILVADRHTLTLRLANHAMLGMLALEAPLPAATSLGDFLTGEQRAEVIACGGDDARTQGTRVELVLTRRDGTAIMAEASITPLVLAGERCIIAVVRDITQQRRQEREQQRLMDDVIQAQKMESIGVFAGGVAHDFNNLLAVITGYVEMTIESEDTPQQAREDLLEVRLAAERSAELTRKLLAFGRKQAIRRVPLDLNVVAHNTDKLLRRIIGEDIKLSLQPGEDLGLVFADNGQLEQVIMNLAANARDAMKAGGVLRLKTYNRQVDGEFAMRHPGLAPGEYVVLQVADTGCGMDEVTARRVFEPYFTTKPEGQGTGLGLSTVYGIVKQQDGHITLTSAPGAGTTFDIYLPRVEGAVSDGAVTAVASLRVGGTETVLVVEDADPVRSLAVRILDAAGYKLLTAVDGLDALRVCASYPQPIDLVLTDVVMPRMSGDQLAARLEDERPDVRVLFMSGYVGDARQRIGELVARKNFIAKPFSVQELLTMVRSVLDRRRTRLQQEPETP